MSTVKPVNAFTMTTAAAWLNGSVLPVPMPVTARRQNALRSPADADRESCPFGAVIKAQACKVSVMIILHPSIRVQTDGEC